jgi:type IV secretion system protein VirB9
MWGQTVCIGWLCVVSSAVFADALPRQLTEASHPPGVVDTRVRTVPYVADQVYRLYGAVGYAIHIELEPGEQYRGLGAGDSEAIAVDVQDHHLFLKPRASGVATNLIVVTDRRRYHFEYHVASGPLDGQVEPPPMYSLRFVHPPAPESEASRVERALANSAPELVRHVNVDYWYCGHPALKPDVVTDDGVHTRIRFGTRSEIPAMFVRHQDGTEALLNFSLQDGEVIIHRLAPTLILRRGRLVGCIVNRGYVGSGERLPNGTISPNVVRDVKQVHP